MRQGIIAIFLTLFTTSIFGQWSFGPRVGVGASTTSNESVIVVLHQDALAYELDFIGNSISKTFGVYGERSFDFAFLQVAALHNSYTSSFEVSLYGEKAQGAQVYYQKFQNIDISVLAGGKYKKFRLGAGPIFGKNVSTKSDFTALPGVEVKNSGINLGSQAAFGIDLGVFNIDVRYIRMVKSVGNNLHFANVLDNGFKTRPNEIKLTIGTSF